MKNILLSVSLLILLINAQSQKLTLQQCVETAIANNLVVQQSELQMQSDQVRWNQAKFDMLPNLNANVNHGLSQGRSIDPFTNSYINENLSSASYNLSSGVLLFNGFTLQNTVKQTKLAYEASKMTLQQRKDNLTISVILAYLQVLNNEDIVNQLTNQADLSKKQVERLEILNKEGAITPSQLSDLKGQYAGDQVSLVNAKGSIESAKLNLCQLMNIPYDKNMSLEKIDVSSMAVMYDDTPANIYQTALDQFALVKAVNYSRLSAEKAVRAAKGGLFPILSLNGNVFTNYSNVASSSTLVNTTDVASSDYVVINGNQSPVFKKQGNFLTEKISYGDQLNNNRYSSLGLNLRVPIFNSMRQRNNIKLAKLQLKNTELIEKSTKTELQQSIEQAHLNMTNSFERQKLLQEQEEAFKESFRAAEIRFNAGLGTSIDYLTTKNNYDRTNINLINAKYDYILRTKILDYYKGVKLW